MCMHVCLEACLWRSAGVWKSVEVNRSTTSVQVAQPVQMLQEAAQPLWGFCNLKAPVKGRI